mgnify:CR=1 FL=1|jgi:hypothetical protein
MKFCNECDNYLNLQVKTDEATNKNKLIYVCRNCNYTQENSQTDNCIYKNNFNSKFMDEFNSQYLEEEHTLPRLNNINCPNSGCISNQASSKDGKQKNINEVVYIVVNKANMIFQYKCCNCHTIWKNR